MSDTRVIKVTVYDSVKMEKMGRDEGYMGTFDSQEAAEEYVGKYHAIFEGDAVFETLWMKD